MLNSPSSTLDLAPRFRESAFREYETRIATAVQLHPARLTMAPIPGRSQETIACRFRDAVRSLVTYRWNTMVDMSKLDKIYPSMTVCREGDLVVVAWNKKQQATVEQTNIAPALVIHDRFGEHLSFDTICYLVEKKLLSSVLVIHPPEDWRNIVEHHDIGIITKPDNAILLV